jgi:hypothetical protein
MNAVEIEAALSDLALEPFNAAEFPFQFLAAFGNKETALKRLRTGNNNASDLPGGVLSRNNIHLATCEKGKVGETLQALRLSPATSKAKAKFILATDGETLEAEELITGETVTSGYTDFPNHFGMFLPLAGISTIKEIKDNPIDVRATSRLNKLYVELLQENPEWAKSERRADMNHFMARLIFCFFAEDTGIFTRNGLFSQTVEQMSERDGSNTHEVLEAVFRAMNIKTDDRSNAQPRLPNWAGVFPYVNGGLFSGSTEVPHFTRIARTYLSHASNLNWKEINPDIFGSMIQAVADDEERGALGMHYTSVPNILKVLNPLFLDDLRTQLEACGDNKAKLLNLRKRMARIRVFDPACGSGNFLVIAYKQMRQIEAEINRRRDEEHLRSEIPLTNFRGIELRDFPAEIARLALIIAEFQCDVLYRGQQDALAEFLPLDAENWIVSGNALRLDWLSICPPTGTGVKVVSDDLFNTPLDQKEIDFENEGGETYICGNPPYKGTKNQSAEEKSDLQQVFSKYTTRSGTLDYVCGWFFKASQYATTSRADYAFVSTNSVCQGGHVPVLWPLIFNLGLEIKFAYQSFKWKNLASHNAGVSVVVVGCSLIRPGKKRLFQLQSTDAHHELLTDRISPYLIPGLTSVVEPQSKSSCGLAFMSLGNAPYDGGHLILEQSELDSLGLDSHQKGKFIRPLLGSSEIIDGVPRLCVWIEDENLEEACAIPAIKKRIDSVSAMRLASKDAGTRAMARKSHQFREMNSAKNWTIADPLVSTETRAYLTPDLIGKPCSMTNKSYALYDAEIWNFSILSSRIHLCWIATVCGRMKTDYSYSNKMGWNTFPVPLLTEQNKTDLATCAEAILLAREAHFPATIADLYDPEKMPENLRVAHERNDEVIERIYIGRRFKNDTERLEKLFQLYTKMTADASGAKKGKKK